MSSPLPPALSALAGAGPWLIIGTILAWVAALFSGLAGSVALPALHLLTLAAILGAMALAVDAAAGWRGGARSIALSVEASALAFAALTTALLFLGFGLAGF